MDHLEWPVYSSPIPLLSCFGGGILKAHFKTQDVQDTDLRQLLVLKEFPYGLEVEPSRVGKRGLISLLVFILIGQPIEDDRALKFQVHGVATSALLPTLGESLLGIPQAITHLLDVALTCAIVVIDDLHFPLLADAPTNACMFFLFVCH
jgi:hypothetical protein